jgi:formylglycine-generating enzyme required for sulfatase activity
VGLPAGHFIMGSCPEGGECPRGAIPDIHAREEETAAHPVSIDRAFQISETPITVAQFQTFLDSPQALADEAATDVLAINQQFLDANQGDRNRPVTFISWANAKAFVDWLNKIKAPSDKGIYRLPTEAEWEYAARSGSQTGFWWGGEPSLDMANCVGCTERYHGKISPVASFPPNLFGLYDMNGNVWEWMEDCYRGWYVSTATDGRAYEKPECQDRSIRGGGADYPTPYWSRATSRFFNKASSRSPTLGFRIVRNPPPEEISTQWPGPAAPITGGKPIASGDNSGSPERAFDGQTDTMWISAERGNQVKAHAWIGYQLANPKAVRWIRIQQPTNPPYRQDMVRVESSSDGISWSPAAESAFQLVGETAWIYLPKAEPARFWRLVAAADNATAPEYAWVVVELGLYPARGDMESDSVSPPRAGPQRAELNQK